MTVRLGVLAFLEAKEGKGSELGAFLESGRVLAAAEAGTVTWYAFKTSDTSYGIFDTFETEDARQDHLQRRNPACSCGGRAGFAGCRPRHPNGRRHRGEVAQCAAGVRSP